MKENLGPDKENDYIQKPFFLVQLCPRVCNPKGVKVCSCNDWVRCGYCRNKRRNRNQKKILATLKALNSISNYHENLKLLTLTFARKGELKSDLNGLIKAFERLKRRISWKSKVKHYVGVIEFSPEGIHIHLIILSGFWRHGELVDEWKNLTGNNIVDIRKVNFEDAKKKLGTYLVKDINPEIKKEVALMRDQHKKLRFLISSRGLPSLLVNRAIVMHRCEECDCQIGYIRGFNDIKDAEDWILKKKNE